MSLNKTIQTLKSEGQFRLASKLNVLVKTHAPKNFAKADSGEAGEVKADTDYNSKLFLVQAVKPGALSGTADIYFDINFKKVKTSAQFKKKLKELYKLVERYEKNHWFSVVA